MAVTVETDYRTGDVHVHTLDGTLIARFTYNSAWEDAMAYIMSMGYTRQLSVSRWGM